MHASPRLRRLRNDLAALEQLRSESSVFSFTAQGNPPHHYQITFKGRSLWRDRGQVRPLELHRIEIKLGASYPRTMPEIRWITPIYHPNISEIGMVCLGGYGTNWVPSVQLDELCTMLWDMARYHNYDIRSPYNRDSALWAANQVVLTFPTDTRSLRDLRVAKGRIAPAAGANGHAKGEPGDQPSHDSPRLSRVRRFSHFYESIFGSRDHSEIQIERVESRTKQTSNVSEIPPESSPRDKLNPSNRAPSEPILQDRAEDAPIPEIESTPDEAVASRPSIERIANPEPMSPVEFVFQDVQESSRTEGSNSFGGDEEILFIG